MSISTFFGSQIPAIPVKSATREFPCGSLVIECSSRPKKKATAHHMKTRPRKTQPWDIKRKPTVYPPLPSLPPEWTLVSSSSGNGDMEPASEAIAASSPPIDE